MSVACPRCRHVQSPEAEPRSGWMICEVCDHRWQMLVVPPVERSSFPSDEYTPDEPGRGTEALTGRRESGVVPVIVLPKPVDRRPVSPRGMPVQLNIDSGLFDRLEREAQEERSRRRTMPELVVEQQRDPELTTCPVCGHNFVRTKGSRHTCPQCRTTFDESSGRIAVAKDSEDPLIGRVLRGCQIDRKLGEGGMGAVYHARQLSLERSVAIKVLPAELARNRNFITRFEREAKSLARINHPNILHIYDFGEDPELGLYFMVIEFVDGMDLGEVLNRRGILGQVEVLDLLRQALSGLAQAAEKGVIHRDIKPDNLMLGNDGIIKVSDFGLAKASSAETGVTAIGVRVGTPAFMSPEQCDGVDVDWRSDVYNLGCTAFLCLTGRLPFDAETPFAIMLKHKTEPPPSLRELDPSIDRDVDAFIRRLLAKRPAERGDNLRQLTEEVESLEVALAGTDSVLRKSRGPFLALREGPMNTPSPQMPTPHRAPEPESELIVDDPAPTLPPMPSPSQAPGKSASRRATITDPLPDYLRLVDEPVRPAAESTSGGRSAVPPSLPVPPQPQPASQAEIPAAVPSLSPRPPSRRLDVELDAARSRGRRNEVRAVVASGERLYSDGRLIEAAREWQHAAALATDPGEANGLRQRADGALRRAAMKQRVRVASQVVAVAAFSVLAVWGATPWIHNRIADLALDRAVERGAGLDAARRVAGYEEVARRWGGTPVWYSTIFAGEYEVAAASRARRMAGDLPLLAGTAAPVLPPPPPPPQAGAVVDISALEAAYADSAVTWRQLQLQAQALGRVAQAPQRVTDIARLAAERVEAMDAALKRIAAAIDGGRHDEALDLARTFPTSHTRTGDIGARLPLAGTLDIDGTGNVLSDLSVRIDGVPLVLERRIPGEAVRFCRAMDRAVTVEVAATGFVAVRVSVPASATAQQAAVVARLVPAPAWVAEIELKGPWRLLRPLGGERIAGLSERRLAIIRLGDGGVVASRQHPAPSPVFLPWLLHQDGRVLVSALDGAVIGHSAATLSEDGAVLRARGAVHAMIDFEYTLQPGRRGRVVVVGSAESATLAGYDGTREIWRQGALQIHQPPLLLQADDRLIVLEDLRIFSVAEDGGEPMASPLPAPRRGAAQRLGDLLVVPTTTGVTLLRPGRKGGVQVIADAAFANLGPAQIGVGGNLVIAAAPDGSVDARRWDGRTLASLWTVDGEPTVGIAPAVGPDAVAIPVRGAVQVRNHSDGGPLLRVPIIDLAGAPVIVADLVLLPHMDGRVSAYPIRRR